MATGFPIAPLEPMLAKSTDEPVGEVRTNRMDGFRAIVFRGAADVFIRAAPPRRYFPELHDTLLARLPDHCVLDGEIAATAGPRLRSAQLRLHVFTVAMLAKRTPPFVAFDLLAVDGRDIADGAGRTTPSVGTLLAAPDRRFHFTPMTRDRHGVRLADALRGRRPDGVMAKPPDGKMSRASARCSDQARANRRVCGGRLRWHKSGRDAIGSLLPGL